MSIDTIGGNRLDNTTFRHDLYPQTPEGVREIRMSIVGVPHGEQQYALVNTIQDLFRTHVSELTQKTLSQGMIAEIDDPASPLQGRWLITSRTVGCIFWRVLQTIITWIKQWFACFYTPPTDWKIDVEITNIKGSWCEELAARISGAVTFLHVKPSEGLPLDIRTLPIPQTTEQILGTPNFADPATRLSRLCLQTVEGPYVMEGIPDSHYCFAIEDESLALKRLPGDAESNRTAFRYYVAFLKREFGLDFLTQIQQTCGIDFATTISSGLPLTPDIVCRCNVCANNIEMQHLEKLWHRLGVLKSRNTNILAGNDGEYVWATPHLGEEKRQYILPWRVMRKLLSGRSEEQVRAFLNDLIGDDAPQSVQDLPPDTFNIVRSLIESTPEELDRAYTGRKITHIAISGFSSIGSVSIPNPCSCQSELLQIFQGLKKDWRNFIELAAHVYSKKNLFRTTPDQRKDEWHVGSVIPGPMGDDGQATSFYTHAVVDDGQGSFSYVLEPACHGYRLNGRALPWFKVYRSTNSSPNSPGWWLSMMADLNTRGYPGSMNPDAAYVKERTALDKRSLPTWSAYLEVARLLSSDPAISSMTYEQAIATAVDELDEYLLMVEPTIRVEYIEPLRKELTEGRFDHVEKLLKGLAKRYHERISDKIPQDTFHIGHSLGGANAQLFTWHHFTKQRRIPMVGCTSYTVDFNGPAIDKARDEDFMSFGRRHQELMRVLDVHFSVQHQFEYGDIVTQGGYRHLATSGTSDADGSWLSVKAYVFKPNIYDEPRTASALPITTLQTHGRRIGEAVEGEKTDYTQTPVTPQELVEFHDSWYLSQELRRRFGFLCLISPFIGEKIRHIAGLILTPLGQILAPIFEIEPPVRTHQNVTYVEYAYDPSSVTASVIIQQGPEEGSLILR